MRNKRGFTLIELIVTMAVLSVMTFSIGVFVVKGLDIWIFYRDRDIAQSQARLILNRLTNEIFEAASHRMFYVVSPNEVQFIKIDPRDETKIINMNRVGFYWDKTKTKKIYFYDMHAYTNPVNNPSAFAGSAIISDPNYIYKSGTGITALRFEIAEVENFELSYYAQSSLDQRKIVKIPAGSLGLSQFTDPYFPYNGEGSNVRFIKVDLTTKQGEQEFRLQSVIGLKNDYEE